MTATEPVASSRDPAVGLVELASLAVGVVVGDAMVKAAPLRSIYAGTIHPGRFVVLVSGDTASVEVALEVARDRAGGALRDLVFIPDVHPTVADAVVAVAEPVELVAEALGIVETITVPAVVDAADAAVKAAKVRVSALRLADGLGGKGYLLLSGPLVEIEPAVDAACARAGDRLLHHEIVAQLHEDMARNLVADLGFLARVATRSSDRKA